MKRRNFTDIEGYKVYRMINHIKVNNIDICFDTFDLIHDFDRVLAELGIYNDEDLTERERQLLFDELYKLAEKQEFAEMSRLYAVEDEPAEYFLRHRRRRKYRR